MKKPINRPRKKPGPKSGFVPGETAEAVRKLSGVGKTLVEIAKALRISVETLCYWRNQHPELNVAFALGREDATDRVERALFERAIGYEHPTTKVVVVSGEIHKVPLREHHAPDTAAIKMWLTNKRPKDWRDKPEEPQPTTQAEARVIIQLPDNGRGA